MGSEKNTPPEQLAAIREQASRLFQEHEGFIRSAIRFVIQNPSDRDDFYQDLFLSFILDPPFGDIQKPRGFFYRLVHERASDWYRNQARRRKALLKFYRQARIDAVEKGAEPVVSDADELAVFFEKVQTHLKTNEGQAILYRYKENYTLKETALKLGVKPETAARYICSGLKKIRKVFSNKKD